MKPKRILILSLAYFPDLVGGAEVSIKEITDRISPSGAVFSAQGGSQPKTDEPAAQALGWDMITLRFNSNLPKFEKIGNVNVHRIGFTKANPSQSDLVRFPLYLNKVLFPLLAVWKFWQLDRKNHYDGIWAMMSYMGMTATLIRIFGRKIPFFISIQEGDDLNAVFKRWFIKPFVPLIKKAFRDAFVVQVISEYLAKWAREMGAKNVIVIPNGVDLKRFTIHDSRFTIRKKYGIAENEKVVITTSRLVHKNGVDILIKAMQFLPEDIKLLIVGNGPLFEDLRQITRQTFDEQKLSGQATNDLQLGNRVIFEGFVTQEKIPECLYASDVFCRPSRFEGQGISFLEAMAMGLPVVATPVGGIVDFLKDKETGLFARLDDAEDVARKILILVRDEAIRAEIVQNAEKLVKEKYNWDNIVLIEKKEIFDKI